VTPRLFHLALARDWADAFVTGDYVASTIGATLDEVGFIHLSYIDQVVATADAFYRGRADVMLLAIDPTRVGAEVRAEPAPGTGELFPHLYGPLPVVAVLGAYPLELRGDGTLDLTPHVGP
jgi:glutathione S-transferase